MSDYIIYADSSCDIDKETLKKWNVNFFELTFMFDGSDKQYRNFDLAANEFYTIIRSGMQAKTSAINTSVYYDAFKKCAEQGQDVMYIAFSSGLSSTYQNACIAANDVLEEYPGRKIVVVDSLCASAGYGMLLHKAVGKRDEGLSLDENADYINELKYRINSWFTVDDLKYLRKGGRIGVAAAKVANKIGIKPVLHMDDEGHLVYRYMVRGKKAAFKALLEEYAQRAKMGEEVFISHGDNMEAVNKLSELFKELFGVSFTYVADVGPVIGGHTGPGVVSIFFEGAGR